MTTNGDHDGATLLEKWIIWLKNNPVSAAVILIFIVISAIIGAFKAAGIPLVDVIEQLSLLVETCNPDDPGEEYRKCLERHGRL